MGKQINYWMDYDNFLLLSRRIILLSWGSRQVPL